MMGQLFTDVFPNVRETNLYQAMERCLKNQTTEHVDYFSGRVGTFFEVHLYPSEEGLSAYIRDVSKHSASGRRIASQ